MSHDLASMVGDRRLVAYTSLLEFVERMDGGDADAFFERLAASVHETVPFDGFAIWRYDAADQMLRKVVWHAPITLDALPPEVPVDFGPAGRALTTQQPITLRLGQGPGPPVVVLLHQAGFRVLCVVPASTSKGHWGLLGMRERAGQIGAKVAVRSSPGQGVRVSLQVPYHARGGPDPRYA